MNNTTELLNEITKRGGKVEVIKRVCQFENSADDNLHSFCKQIKDHNSDYMAFMGLGGGLGAYCLGQQSVTLEGQVLGKDIPPCPYRGDDKILGWRIILPAEQGVLV